MDMARSVATRNGVVAGSIWESRMKIDEVKGGMKVFNAEENSEENVENSSYSSGLQGHKMVKPKQSLVGVSGKRKTWKSESSEGFERNPIEIAKQRSESSKNLDEQCKELSVSADGIKKTPIQKRKTRSEAGKELSVSVDGMERGPIRTLRTRSLSLKGSSESSAGMERNSIQLRKVKSEANKASDDSGDGIGRNAELRKVKSEANKALDESVGGNERNSIQLTKEKPIPSKVVDESVKSINVLGNGIERNSVELGKEKFESNHVVERSVDGIEKNPIGIKNTRSDETCKEYDVCEEKIITSHLGDVGQVKSPPKLEVDEDNDDGDEEDWDEELKEEVDEEIEIEIEKKSFDVKEINIPAEKPKKIVIEERKIHQRNEKPVPISPIVRKQLSPVVNNPRIIPNPTRTTSNEFQRVRNTHGKLQSFFDLVMWRDVSRSTFVFGIGTFIIISSSYTKDLNISLISVVSYLGLVYLAVIFLLRSIICRGAIDVDDTSQDHVLREEEALWLLKLILPYINEFLLKLRVLFSGDPSTTMKLAVLLFILARCGSSLTIWKMAKLGFFGVFTVPRVCSSYSTQITAYGTFWIRRFRDAWESCSHKKAVAFAVFTLVWNLSSAVARIWAVFMLSVAFRYYQHSLMREDWVVVEEEGEEEEEEARGGKDSWQGQVGGQRHGRGPTILEIRNQTERS